MQNDAYFFLYHMIFLHLSSFRQKNDDKWYDYLNHVKIFF